MNSVGQVRSTIGLLWTAGRKVTAQPPSQRRCERMSDLTIDNCLIADDNSFDRRIARSLVKQKWPNAIIQEARSTKETSERLLTEKPDLAILDNDMGDGTSIEAIQTTLRQLNPPRPILIMVSGNPDPALRENACNVGFDGFISKDDFDFRTLSSVIDAIQPRNDFSTDRLPPTPV